MDILFHTINHALSYTCCKYDFRVEGERTSDVSDNSCGVV